MKSISYTQEFYLCAINDKGELSFFSKGTEIECAFFASAMMELLEHGYVKSDENEYIISINPLDDSHSYLKPLYDFIVAQKKPMTLKDLAPEWMVSFKINKPSGELLAAIGSSLATLGYADELSDKGLLKSKTRFVPKPEAVKPVIEKIRAELLEDGNITNETICLTALLDSSRIVGNYFSKVEADDLKKRLEEIKNSEAFSTVKDVLERITATIIAAIV